MKHPKKPNLIWLFTLLFMTQLTRASDVDFLPVWGSNAQNNFDSAELAINDNDTRIEQLLTQVASLQATVNQLVEANQDLQAQVDAIESDSDGISGLADYVSVEIDEHGYAAVVFDSVNVHIRNGEPNPEHFLGSNGLGNLILGYNTINTNDNMPASCASGHFPGGDFWGSGEIPNQTSCEASGYAWGLSHKTGSHSLIAGSGHSYTGPYNIVTGWGNSALDGFSTVSGSYNVGAFSSTVFGGILNQAYYGSAIFDGSDNTAVGISSVIIGGHHGSNTESSTVVIGGEE